MITQTWAEIVSGLDEALAFADSLKIDTTNTRFTSYRARTRLLDAIRMASGDTAAFTQFKADVELNAIALSESQELASVVPFLRSAPRERVRKKLQVVLKGPDTPSDEDSNSNHARNTMFELNIAARIQIRVSADIRGESCSRPALKGERDATVSEAFRGGGHRAARRGAGRPGASAPGTAQYARPW